MTIPNERIWWRGAWRTLQGGAPDPIKITVTGADGKPFEADLPPGFLPQAVVEKDYIPRTSHNLEFQKFRTRAADELLGDQEFRTKALQAWEIDPEALKQFLAQGAGGGGGKGKLDEKQLAELKQKWSKEELDPVKAQLESEGESKAWAIQLLMEREVIDAALAVGVDPALLQPTVPGDRPPIVKWFENLVAWDDEHQAAFACDPANDEFRISGKRRDHGEPQYQTVLELMEDWAKDARNARYITNNRQRGSNFQRPSEGGRGGAPTVIDGSDPREFGANLDAIAAGKVQVRIPGMPAPV